MHAQSTAQEDRAADVTPPVVPRMPWRVRAVQVLPGYRLDVVFVDGTRGVTDLSALIHSEDAGVFASLRDPALFSRCLLYTSDAADERSGTGCAVQADGKG